MGMDQYLLIPFLVGWTSIYQLFWCSPGLQGFDTLPYGPYERWEANESFSRRVSPFSIALSFAGMMVTMVTISTESVSKSETTTKP